MSTVYREKSTQTKTYKNMPQNVTIEKGNYLPQTSFTDTINKKTILSNSNYAVSIALFLDFVKWSEFIHNELQLDNLFWFKIFRHSPYCRSTVFKGINDKNLVKLFE